MIGCKFGGVYSFCGLSNNATSGRCEIKLLVRRENYFVLRCQNNDSKCPALHKDFCNAKCECATPIDTALGHLMAMLQVQHTPFRRYKSFKDSHQ